jgi:hypothetical protein
MISFHVSFLVGPVLARAVTAAAGLRVCYLVDAVSFGAALYSVARLPTMPPEDGDARPGFRAVAEGLRHIRRLPVLTAVFLLMLVLAADRTTVIFWGSVVQTITPDRFRGGVMAVDYVAGAGVPRLGNFEAGAVARLTSPAVSAVSGGLAALAGVAVIRLAFPAVARYGARARRAENADDAMKEAITSQRGADPPSAHGSVPGLPGGLPKVWDLAPKSP